MKTLDEMLGLTPQQRRVWDKAIMLIRAEQHEATWAMAMEAAAIAIHFKLGLTSRAIPVIRALPCPPLTPTESK